MDIQSIPVLGDIINYFTSDNSVPTRSAGTSSSAVADPSLTDRIWAFFEGRGQEIVVSTYTDPTVGLPGCTSEGESINDYLGEDGGIPLDPPDTDGGYTTPDSPDAEVYLPEGNEGEPILPDDIWFNTDGEGNSGSMFFEESGNIVLGTGPLVGSGLQNISELRIGLALDSTLIGPIQDSPDIPDNPNIPAMPAEGCFPGMIDITPAYEDEFFNYSAEPPYEEFMVSPANENNRLPLYLADWSIACYDQDSNQISLPAEVSGFVFATPAELEADPANGESLVERLFCADGGPNFFNIVVPQECYHENFGGTGFVDAEINFSLYLDNFQAVQEHVYQTYLRARMYIGEE